MAYLNFVGFTELTPRFKTSVGFTTIGPPITSRTLVGFTVIPSTTFKTSVGFTALPEVQTFVGFTVLQSPDTSITPVFAPDGLSFVVYNDSEPFIVYGETIAYGLMGTNLRYLTDQAKNYGLVVIKNPNTSYPNSAHVLFEGATNGDGVYKFRLIQDPVWEPNDQGTEVVVSGSILLVGYALHAYQANRVVNNALACDEVLGRLDSGYEDVRSQEYLKFKNYMVTMQAEFNHQASQPIPNFSVVYRILDLFDDPIKTLGYGNTY